MGRGRAKAKQTKVARELKYQTFGTDFDALQRELHPGSSDSSGAVEVGPERQGPPPADDEDDEYDPYARYLDDDEDDARRA